MTRNAESIQPMLAIILFLINGLVCFIDKSVVYFDSSRSLFVSIVYRYEIYMPKLKKTENTQHGYFSYSKYDQPRLLVGIGICTSKKMKR